MVKIKEVILLAVGLLLLAGCSPTPQTTPTIPAPVPTHTPTVDLSTPTEPPVTQKISTTGKAFQMNQRLGRGVNFGNALEAPKEGDWGVTIKASFFPAIKSAGFSSVRIPIGWSFHAASTPPYTIDPEFFKRVDWAIEQAQQNGLLAILDMHNYNEMMNDPQAEKARFMALWEQIADHYKNYPEEVLFELLNEPNGALNFNVWNSLIKEVIPVIRKTNPNRYLVIGPSNWNGLTYLDSLVLPETDRNIIVTFHYYSPMQLTHQGANWVQGSDAWLGTTWSGSSTEQLTILDEFDQAVEWSVDHNRPLYLGEFGCYSKADPTSRLGWTSFIARQAEERNISWGYWNFSQGNGSEPGFGVYDSTSDTWRQPLLETLIPNK